MIYAVIGAGMIGSAAARHLAQAGYDVVLIGPSEPEDKTNHTGAFASHYDAGRITRGLATDPFWAQASLASIARYRQIEADSGISFYNDVGCLLAGQGCQAFAKYRSRLEGPSHRRKASIAERHAGPLSVLCFF